MKCFLLFLSITFAGHCHLAAFESGYLRVGQSYTAEELPVRGKMLKPERDGALFFYLPRVYEVFVAEDGGEGLLLRSRNRASNFSGKGLFYSRDGKQWFLGGGELHFVDVWTHPETGMYFAAIAGFSYFDQEGRAHRRISFHIVASKDAADWHLIQGDLDPFLGFPRFFVDPTNEAMACLFFFGRDVAGMRWRIAQAADDSYSNWQLFDSTNWEHDVPRED